MKSEAFSWAEVGLDIVSVNATVGLIEAFGAHGKILPWA
jgi:hypothetical protein